MSTNERKSPRVRIIRWIQSQDEAGNYTATAEALDETPALDGWAIRLHFELVDGVPTLTGQDLRRLQDKHGTYFAAMAAPPTRRS